MLATHPAIAGTVAESHLFDQGVDRLFENVERPDRYEAFLSGYVSPGELEGLVRDLCDGVFLAMRDKVKPEAERVLEKTPSPRTGAEDLARRKVAIYPDATYVHVVREQDAVVRSLQRAPWTDVTEDEAGEWWRQAVDGVRAACGDASSYI
jgi:hypothetical protein